MNIPETVISKIEEAQRLSREDGLALMRSTDILSLGRLARTVKQQKTGDTVFFNANCHVNLTNVCSARCGFCAFSCDPGDPRAYVMAEEDVLDRIRAAQSAGITEVHMVSGLHPDKPFSYYCDMVRAIRRGFPSLHIKAFTAVEIQYFSKISGLPVEDVLIQLKEAGLGSLPGGGAEVLSDRIRLNLCPNKATAGEWLDVMRIAHGLGLKSNATLLFGHVESNEEIIDHLLLIRDLQDETGGFQTFIPLPFHPENTTLTDTTKPAAFEILKICSVSRLMLDNIDHIKAYWIMTGLKVAQMALFFGADDVDGTVTEEKITHAAGADTAVGVSRDTLIHLIKEAGCVPVQRDTLYNSLETF